MRCSRIMAWLWGPSLCASVVLAQPREPLSVPAVPATQPTHLAGPAAQPERVRYNGSPNDIMLQGFHWGSHQKWGGKSWYQIVAENGQEIRSAGFTAVWFAPPTDSGDDNGYLPRRWYDLNSSRYGTEQELKGAIAAIAPAKAIADIVINHRVGVDTAGPDFDVPKFDDNGAAVCSDDECGEGQGAADLFFEKQGAGRDLDHTDASVRMEVVRWLGWLKSDIGFSGWRFDQVKGFHGHFVGVYDDATSPYLSVGEYWDGDRQKVVNWIDQTHGKSMAFDYPTRELLKTAVAERRFSVLKTTDGKPTGLIGWWREMCVTFVENHDVEQARQGANDHPNTLFPQDRILQGYAYILTHPGTPCIFWRHYFDFGEQTKASIRRMMEIRRTSGIGRDSVVNIVRADDNNVYAATIDDKVAVKIGPGPWSPGDGWGVAADGEDFAIWTRR